MQGLLLASSLALLLLSLCSTSSAFEFPDCNAAPLAGTPICNVTLSYGARAAVSRLSHTSPLPPLTSAFLTPCSSSLLPCVVCCVVVCAVCSGW